MNPKYETVVKEENDKVLVAGFIYKIEHIEWLSPIMIVTKKNGKIQVCVDLKNVNVATVRDHYPLPCTEHVLKRVVGHEAYVESQAQISHGYLDMVIIGVIGQFVCSQTMVHTMVSSYPHQLGFMYGLSSFGQSYGSYVHVLLFLHDGIDCVLEAACPPDVVYPFQ